MTFLPSKVDQKQHQIFCDGAAVPNPGQMGIGVVTDKSIISLYKGEGTNQIAELLALGEALKLANPGDTILSDSQYAINVAAGCWRVKCHFDLVAEVRELLRAKAVALNWTRGHAGHLLQELADRLANQAARTKMNFQNSRDGIDASL